MSRYRNRERRKWGWEFDTMTELLLFISSFLCVFALGFQSLNVNNGHYTAAFFTSFLIGTSNLLLFKMVPNACVSEMAAYLLGGPLGIICAMKFHGWFRGRKNK